MSEEQIVNDLSDALAKGGTDGILEVAGLVIALRRRIIALEEMPKIKYIGNWIEGEIYSAGNVVSLGGSAWICERATEDRPTTHSPYWKLMVKAGRDGRPK